MKTVAVKKYGEQRRKDMAKLYTVTKDEWGEDNYGIKIYLKGIFSDKDKAKKLAEELKEDGCDVKITEVEEGKVYFGPSSGKDEGVCSADDEHDLCLGGYVE